MPRSLDRAFEIDSARNAIREQKPWNVMRETRWQYDNRIAEAARDAIARVQEHRANEGENTNG